MLGLLTMAASREAAAQQADDLDRIPKAVSNADANPTPPPTTRPFRLQLEDAATTSWADQGAFGDNLQNRLSLDGAGSEDLAPGFRVTLSDRFSLLSQDGVKLGSDGSFQNDLREAFVSWQPASSQVLDVGRINLKSGVALAFNPTDYFKEGSAVLEASADPTVLKQGRLGTFMADFQQFWGLTTLSLALAPRLDSPRSASSQPPPLDLAIDRTNTTNRAMASLSFELADLNPQVMLFADRPGVQIGFNMSHLVSSSTLVYLEWSGGRQLSLVQRTIRDETSLGIPASGVLPGDGTPSFLQSLSVGASWSNAQTKTTINLEYNRYGGGLSGAEARALFSAEASPDPATQAVAAALREAAVEAQEPLARQQLFARIAQSDAIVRNLDLSAFVVVDLRDSSATAQLAASYPVTGHFSVAGYLTVTGGRRRSDFGSVPGASAFTLQLIRYF